MKNYVTKPLSLVTLLAAMLSPLHLLAEDSFFCDQTFNIALDAEEETGSPQVITLTFGEQESRESGLKHCGEIQVTSDTRLQTSVGDFDFAPGVKYDMWSVFDECDRYCPVFASREVAGEQHTMENYLIFQLYPDTGQIELGISGLIPQHEAKAFEAMHWFPGATSSEWF